MRVIIDRFDGDYAVIETEEKSMKKIKRAEIPSAAREGDILVFKNNKWNIDSEATQRRKEQIAALAAELWEDE
ncbi:MAG: DUF3006 domain-containing protein [Syntrophomonas sp.]